jgi:hypothetical protein
VVASGSETNRKPFLAAVGGHVLASTGGVVAVTSIVADPSKKSPVNASSQSVQDFVKAVLHSIRSELMMELTFPSGWPGSSEFGTVKPSNTRTSFTWSEASPFFKSTLTAPSDTGAVQKTPLGLIPGSYECGPNEPVVLSSQMKANAPLWTRPSVPRNLPAMNRMSV